MSAEYRRCHVCGRWTYTDTHHMIGGTRRKAADRLGLTVELCRDCHAALHDRGVHADDLKREAQERFEREHGRDEWMRIFHKNYLD